MLKFETTCMSSIIGDELALVTLEDSWPVIEEGRSSRISEEKIRRIVQEVVGLNRHWDCLPKSRRAQRILGFGDIAIGSLLVNSSDGKSQYGYYFNPPYEFHSWVHLGDGEILDVALPGVIEKGINTSDEIGPFIVGRVPAILCGTPPSWCIYTIAEIYKVRR